MSCMFDSSHFNGDISLWNVENVKNMSHMFNKSQFNGDISLWNIEKVENIDYMFSRTKFNRDLDKWIPKSLNYHERTFELSPLEGGEPIWYQCLELKLFKNGEDYCYSLDWNWLRSGKVISRFRLEEAIEHFNGDLTKIDMIKDYTFIK